MTLSQHFFDISVGGWLTGKTSIFKDLPMLSTRQKANLYLNYFGFSKVPLLWLCHPKILTMNEEMVELKIPLKRRTKNHLNSMYFGALAIGADVAGGFLAFMKAENQGVKISLAFKGFNAQFLKRPEADVHFKCLDGHIIDQMLEQTIASGERVNQNVRITATCPSLSGDEPVAQFDLTLSLKVKV
jgi:acyl-coenzyme A thioesterase PaaI-like protein